MGELGWRFGATDSRAACRMKVGFGSSEVCSQVVTIAEVDERCVVSMLRRIAGSVWGSSGR